MSVAYLLAFCLFAIFAQTLRAEPKVIDIFNVGGEQDIMQLRSGPRKLFNAIQPNSTRKWATKDQSGFTVIPYVISADYGAKTSIITAAMQSIAENTCIRFKARGNEPDYVEIKNIKGKGCSAFVGHSPGSNPVMLEDNSEATCLRHDLVIHELLHAIGLWHEHQRIDRDKYVQVNYSNIAADDWSQFALIVKDFGATTYDLPYDYTSIMHYGKTVFSRTGGITMQTLDPKYQDVIGTAKEPSASDYRKVCLAYGCQTCMGNVCDAGFYYDDGAKKCRLCPRGTYQEKRGGLSCLPCPSDSTTVLEGAKNATDCSFKCAPGQEMDDAANCVPCAKGTYWVSGSFTGCTDCPQGLTTKDTGSKDIRDCEIVDCPRGTHVNTNRTEAVDPTRAAFDTLCLKCEMGTYQDERNQTTCKPCTPTSDCPLVNECSPLLSNTCEDGSSCILMELGIYSCSTVVIKPIPESNNWILWVIVPLVVLVIMTALVVAGWIYRHSLYTTICCRKLDPKLLESREYYRPASRPVVANRIVEVEGYRNYPPRRRDTVRPTEIVGTASQAPQRQAKPARVLSSASMAPPRRSIEDPNMVRLRERHLPPPIITSKVELDLLEEQARRKTLSTSVLLTPCRSLGSHIATGVSSESPGPSISAQLPLPRRRTYSNGQPPARPPTEDPSISCSLHWSESSRTASNGAFGDNDVYDDDEDYFG